MRTPIDIQRSELSKANNTFIVPFGFIGQACCNFFFFVRFVQSALILKQMTALASLEFVHSVSFFLVSFSFTFNGHAFLCECIISARCQQRICGLISDPFKPLRHSKAQMTQPKRICRKNTIHGCSLSSF